MATEIFLRKSGNGTLQAVNDDDYGAVNALNTGQIVKAEYTVPRNVKFFRKWWALVDFAYDHWEPGELQDPMWKGVTPEKNKERFRKDLTILAGHYSAAYRVDGSVRIEAKSISFGRMKEKHFEKFYSTCIDVVLKRILINYTREDLEHALEKLLVGFA
ncbi:MAG: DUF1367 family protein [Candidatus Thiodiazotropha sp.]|jgi:hypothetical protein